MLGTDGPLLQRAVEAIHLHRRNAVAGEPVGTLPAELGAVDRAPVLEDPVERAAPHAARALVLVARPGDGVVAAVALDRAVVEEPRAGVQRPEPADVERPQVEPGIALDDPVGHRLADAAGGGDPRGEAAGEKEILQPRRRPDDRLAVGRNRDRPVDDRPDAEIAEQRNAPCGGLEHLVQPFEIVAEKLALAFPRDAPLRVDGWGEFLPAADRQRPRFRLDVEAAVGIAQARQMVGHPVALVGDQVLVLDDAGGDIDAGHPADLARPQPRGVDDDLRLDGAVVGDHTADPRAAADQTGDPHPLENPPAAGADALGERLGQAVGIDIAVVGDEDGADHPLGRHQRKQRLRFRRRRQRHLEAEPARGGRHPQQLPPTIRAGGDPEAADLVPAGVLPGLRVEPLV